MISSSLFSFSLLSLASLISAQDVPAFDFGNRNPNANGVRSTGSNGPTNREYLMKIEVESEGEERKDESRMLTPPSLDSSLLSLVSLIAADSPSLNTPINQTSLARLASVNSIDDWCTFGPHISVSFYETSDPFVSSSLTNSTFSFLSYSSLSLGSTDW